MSSELAFLCATLRYVTYFTSRFALRTYDQSKLFAFQFSKVMNRVENGYRLPSPIVSLVKTYMRNGHKSPNYFVIDALAFVCIMSHN